MRRGPYAWLGLTVMLCVVVSNPSAGQGPASSNRGAVRGTWELPRTPWGDPDLQGVWSSDDMRNVPLERPREYGTRRFLNDEEYAKRLEAEKQFRGSTLMATVGIFRGDFGTRVFRHTSLIVDPPDGRLPAIVPEAQARTAAETKRRESPPQTWEDRSLYDRCITRGVIGSISPTLYGNGNRITQAPGYVAITYEMVHDTRIIPLDARPAIGRGISQYMGDARGRWEGNTLVVETSNFTDSTAVGRILHSTELRIVERFTRTADDTIEYEATIADPKTFSRPWTIAFPITTQPGYDIYEYSCHEGNLAIPNILSGARAWERAVEEATRQGLPPPPSIWRDPQGDEEGSVFRGAGTTLSPLPVVPNPR